MQAQALSPFELCSQCVLEQLFQQGHSHTLNFCFLGISLPFVEVDHQGCPERNTSAAEWSPKWSMHLNTAEEGSEEDRAWLISVVPSDRPADNGNKLNYNKIYLNLKNNKIFH